MLLSLASTALASLTVERTIDGTAEPGQTIDVTLKLKLRDANVSSVIITETIPNGWTLTESNPAGTPFGGNKVKWLLYQEPMADTAIYYTLLAPQAFSSSALLVGQWTTLDGSGQIEGNILLQPKPTQSEPVPVPPAGPAAGDTAPKADYMPYAIGLIIVVIVVIAIFVIRQKKGAAKTAAEKKETVKK